MQALPRLTESARTLGRLVAAAALAGPVWAQGGGGQGGEQALWIVLLPAIAVSGGVFQAVLAALFPHWTAATRLAIQQRRGLCVGWGAVIAVLAFILLLIGSALQGIVAFLAALVLVLVGLLGVAGYVGPAAAMGELLVSADPEDSGRTPLQALVGGLVLCGSSLVPILGQLLALLISAASLGAAALALHGGFASGAEGD